MTLSSLIIKESHRDHKRTQQGVSDVFLHYICYYHKSYPELYISFISPLYYYHKANSYSHAFDIIVLVPSIMFQTYDTTSCDASYDCGHVPLHCPRKKNTRKREIKSRKIKRKSKSNISVQVHHDTYQLTKEGI